MKHIFTIIIICASLSATKATDDVLRFSAKGQGMVEVSVELKVGDQIKTYEGCLIFVDEQLQNFHIDLDVFEGNIPHLETVEIVHINFKSLIEKTGIDSGLQITNVEMKGVEFNNMVQYADNIEFASTDLVTAE